MNAESNVTAHIGPFYQEVNVLFIDAGAQPRLNPSQAHARTAVPREHTCTATAGEGG